MEIYVNDLVTHPNKFGSFVLYGAPGTGLTTMLNKIAKSLQEKSITVFFLMIHKELIPLNSFLLDDITPNLKKGEIYNILIPKNVEKRQIQDFLYRTLQNIYYIFTNQLDPNGCAIILNEFDDIYFKSSKEIFEIFEKIMRTGNKYNIRLIIAARLPQLLDYEFKENLSQFSLSSSNTQLLTISEAARALKVHKATVDRWMREGKLKFERTLGYQRRIPVNEVERIIKDKIPISNADFFIINSPESNKDSIHILKRVTYPRSRAEIEIIFQKRELRIRLLGVTNEEEDILMIDWPEIPLSSTKIGMDFESMTIFSNTYLATSDWNKIKPAIDIILKNRIKNKMHGLISRKNHFSDLWVGSIELSSFITNILIPPFDFSKLHSDQQQEIIQLLNYNTVVFDATDLIKIIEREISYPIEKIQIR